MLVAVVGNDCTYQDLVADQEVGIVDPSVVLALHKLVAVIAVDNRHKEEYLQS